MPNNLMNTLLLHLLFQSRRDTRDAYSFAFCNSAGMVVWKRSQFSPMAITANCLVAFCANRAISPGVVCWGRWHQFMSFIAMIPFSGYGGRRLTSQSIFTIRHRFYMNRINAPAIATQMIANHIDGDCFDKNLIDNSMGMPTTPVVRHRSILVHAISSPFPTRNAVVKLFGRNANLGKDSGQQFGGNRKSDKLSSGHTVFSCLENGLSRLGKSVSALRRAVSIIPQNTIYTEAII